MDALVLLKEQATNAENQLKQLIAPLTPEQGAWQLPGSTANSIAATIMHTYYGEDDVIHKVLGVPSVFEAGGWQQRIGYDPEKSWTLDAKPETDVLREYAAAVAVDTQKFLTGATPATIEQMVEGRRGPIALANRLSVYLVSHKLQHMGEISALMGCQGLKGLP